MNIVRWVLQGLLAVMLQVKVQNPAGTTLQITPMQSAQSAGWL